MARTDDGERVAGHIAQGPLLAESVYLNPRYTKGRFEKEVTDLLLVHRNQAIVIQVKCQEDPEVRSGDKLRNWVERRAMEGAKQLRGALRTLRDKDFWCNHPGLHRMHFAKGQLVTVCGIVLVEHREHGLSLSNALPIEVSGIPVAYFTLSDFFNHVTEFRTFSDLREFLSARHKLTNFDRRLIPTARSVDSNVNGSGSARCDSWVAHGDMGDDHDRGDHT